MGDRTSEQWIAQYASGHQNSVNRICHSFGIPMIAISLFFAAAHRVQNGGKRVDEFGRADRPPELLTGLCGEQDQWNAF